VLINGKSTSLSDIPFSGWMGCWAVSTVFCVFVYLGLIKEGKTE
jgi:hypothetical protein